MQISGGGGGDVLDLGLSVTSLSQIMTYFAELLLVDVPLLPVVDSLLVKLSQFILDPFNVVT